MTKRVPVFVEDGGRTWATVSAFGVAICLLVFALSGDALVEEVDRWAGDSQLAESVLGWVPIGGWATYVAALVWWRGHRLAAGRSVRRLTDRALITLAVVWLGLALSFLPTGRAGETERWDRRIAVPGPEFAQSVRWCVGWIFVTAAFGLILATALVRLVRAPSAEAFAPFVHRWVAASLAIPSLSLLVGLVVT